MIETYDGLCGIIPTFAHSGLQIRCTYELGHHGPCSFEKHRKQFWCHAGSFSRPDPEDGFINSVISHSRYNHHTIIVSSRNKIKIRE